MPFDGWDEREKREPEPEGPGFGVAYTIALIASFVVLFGLVKATGVLIAWTQHR